MASSSHRYCKRCHTVRIDKRAGLEMCQRCKRITLAERRQERHDIKVRRALRAQGVATMPEPEPVQEQSPYSEPTVSPNGVAHSKRDRLAGLSDDLKLIIAGHYANYTIAVQDIVSAYHISNGDITRIADELGVERRDRRNVGKSLPRGTFVDHVWVPDPPIGLPPIPATASEAQVVQAVEVVEQLPEDTLKALERMIEQPTLPVLPPKPEPSVYEPRPGARERMLARQSPPVLVSSDDGSPVWEVQYVGRMLVKARDIDQALERARADGHLTQITGIVQRSS